MATEQQARATLDRLYDVLSGRAADVEKMGRYYRGEQKLKYATDSWQNFHARRFEGFSDNWCQVVADSEAERLLLTGIRIPDDESNSAAKKLWRVWEESDGDMISSQGFVGSLTERRSYTMVWGEDPKITWEHASQVVVGYDPETRARKAALKAWSDDTVEYATVYFPTEVWKFSRPKNRRPSTTESGLHVVHHGGLDGWAPRDVVGESWPMPNPMGAVPIVEWPNRPLLVGEPMSEIGGVASMQDAINLMWAYLFTSADYSSWPQRVIMGAEPPMVPVLDTNGVQIGEKPVDLEKLAQDRFLYLTGQGVSIGQFDPANLEVYLKVVEQAVKHVAAQTRTPPHYLLGQMVNLSAEALKAAETGLVKKVEEAQTFFGAAARETFRLVALAQGDTALAKQVKAAKVQWHDAENRSEAQLEDALLKKHSRGMPFQYLLEREGLSDLEVERVMEMRRAELRDALTVDVEAMLGT